MNYSQTLEYLYGQLPMFSRTGPAAYKEDIHNTVALCVAFEHPEKQFKTIHIAGTNGKGSTSHQLAAILQANGYKTGLYTSPHIRDFRERIRIDGKMISEEAVVDFVKRYQDKKLDISPSFFELTVAMAFDYFSAERVDIAVIETGLGGRLDSTNVIQPILSIITNIGTDHANLLGDTRSKIAFEKAGIIKEKTPVIIGEKDAETETVFLEKTKASQSVLYWSQAHYHCTELTTATEGMMVGITHLPSQKTETILLDLLGHYQLLNLPAVRLAIDLLPSHGFPLNLDVSLNALSSVKSKTGLRGRWELVSRNPDLVLDVAHNKEGIMLIREQINLEYPNVQLHWILGMVQDKDVNAVISMLPTDAFYYCTQAQIPRALPYTDLTNKLTVQGMHAVGYRDVNLALNAALEKAESKDLILVCGSFFILSELDGYLEQS
jgi:dihydrofolate synthase/folylpolyglutamate synthase